MNYKNDVDDRDYKLTNKIGGKKDQEGIIVALDKMDDYPRDKHIMWLCANNYLLAI